MKNKVIEEQTFEEYDEDLVEAFDEDNESEEYEDDLEKDDKEIEKIPSTVEVSFTDLLDDLVKDSLEDKKIEKNISSFLIISTIAKWIMFIIAIIFFMTGISTNEESKIGVLIISLILILSGFLYSIILKWFALTLKCLFDIKNSK